MLIPHKGHTDTIQVYSVTVMTHVKALQAGHSSQGTSEPITGVVNKNTCYSTIYDGQKVTTYTTHQWYVVLEVFCVVYVGKPPTRHVVVGLTTCVVAGKPTTFFHFFPLFATFPQLSPLIPTFCHLGTLRVFQLFATFSNFSPLFPTFLHFSPLFQLFPTFHHFSPLFISFSSFSPLFPTFHYFSLLFVAFPHFSPLLTTFPHFPPLFLTFCHLLSRFATLPQFSAFFTTFPYFSQLFPTFRHF